MRWRAGSFLNGDYFAEQVFCQEIAAADDVADDQAESDDKQGHRQPGEELQHRIMIRGEELSDRGEVYVNKEQVEKIDIQASDPDSLKCAPGQFVFAEKRLMLPKESIGGDDADQCSQ